VAGEGAQVSGPGPLRSPANPPEHTATGRRGGLVSVPLALSLRTVAARLSCSTKTVRRRIAAGDFPGAFRLGGLLRVPESDVLALIARQRVASAPSSAAGAAAPGRAARG
jgi:excisionase family DNA binding protein